MSFVLSTLNANGIRASVRKGLQPWFASSGADVLCLQEVRQVHAEMKGDCAPPAGFSQHQVDAEKTGYSGVAVWSRLPVRRVVPGMGLPEFDREGRMIRVDTDEASVISLYAPSGSSSEERQAAKNRFLVDFLPIAQGLLDEGQPIALCGDINIAHTEMDIHNPKSNKDSSGFLPHERAWFSDLLAQGWVDLFRRHNPAEKSWSWWSQRGQARALDRGWRIDYILCSPQLAERAEACWITGREPAISDHCAVNARFR